MKEALQYYPNQRKSTVIQRSHLIQQAKSEATPPKAPSEDDTKGPEVAAVKIQTKFRENHPHIVQHSHLVLDSDSTTISDDDSTGISSTEKVIDGGIHMPTKESRGAMEAKFIP